MSNGTQTKEVCNEPSLTISSQKIMLIVGICCLSIELMLVLADGVINYGRLTDLGMLRRFFNIAREDSLASWFAVTQTFLVGLTAWAIFIVMKCTSKQTPRHRGWLIIALFFTFMALDDGAELHERLGSAFKKVYTEHTAVLEQPHFISTALDRFPSYPWQLILLPFFACMGLFLLLFLRRELENTSSLLGIVLALGLLAAAVALDFIEGLDPDHLLNIHKTLEVHYKLSHKLVRHFSKSFEEFLEMFATTLIWLVFLKHLFSRTGTLLLKFKH